MARMPSTRAQPLNPHLTGQTGAATPFGWWPSGWPVPGSPGSPGAARAGGFHESSYELRLGLDVSESEWPDDTTVPGALDDGR